MTDKTYMQRALELAYGQLGRTSPNPAVGCVIVRDGQIVAEAATGDGGRPHAEEMALQALGNMAEGATAYVTLEPCGERSGGGCSCSELLVRAKVGRVVFACEDPSPYASHIGTRRLEGAGISVETGLMNEDARGLIQGFVHYLNTGRPLVIESLNGAGCDALYAPDDLSEPAADLAIWGERGFRRLWVAQGSEVALTLAKLGLLSDRV
ncbi:MAG: bifunctional diaminohydroxyphosphoribosylaminopyrimidine deaminase/5-amino-6-(5-phosphoribosylamino)uracil reductase RibD [Asticcacaulis sp.]